MQRKVVSKSGDSYEHKIKLLYQICDKRKFQSPVYGTESVLGTAAQVWNQLCPPQGGETPAQGRCPPSKASPVPAVWRCHTRGRRPVARGCPAEQHRGQHVCPGCALLSALLSSRGDESPLGPARPRGQSRGSRREPASYGFNILINFNPDAQMRVNHSAAVLSNLPSLFIKTFLAELWLNVMLFKGPLKQPRGFSEVPLEHFLQFALRGGMWKLCWEAAGAVKRRLRGRDCSEMLLRTQEGLKLSAEHQRCASTFTKCLTLSTWCSCCLLSFSARM